MKTKRVEAGSDHQVLIAMITNKQVLAQIAAKWDKNLFYSKWSQFIAYLCVKFYEQHQDAPGIHIKDSFIKYAEKKLHSEEERELASQYLAQLNQEYLEQNTNANASYLTDIAGLHFREVQVKRFKNELDSLLLENEVEKIEQLIADYKKVEIGNKVAVDFLKDEAKVRAVFNTISADSLVPFGDSTISGLEWDKNNDALKRFFHGTLCPGKFVAFMASEKSTKSYWLLDLAWRAILAKKKVAYFEAGDLTEEQIGERILTRVSNTPITHPNPDGKLPFDVLFPKEVAFTIIDDKRIADPRTDAKTITKLLDADTAWKYCQKVYDKTIKTKDSYFRLSCFPNDTLSVDTIHNTILDLKNDNWIPDVIIVDYADILAFPSVRGETKERDLINRNWKKLRALSMKFNCLVLTATQADAASYETNTLCKKNFSEDKRKYSHVTAMVGINRTDSDVESSTCRLNWLIRRDGASKLKACVTVGQCLTLANPSTCSAF